uniref:ATP synthase CF0 C subunit n=1 Tax=Boodlea composita TaxID=204414 RepID=A0A2H4UXS5_9CHLO|nr:ATP synthase CF0 C subunit [Boodlea composita]
MNDLVGALSPVPAGIDVGRAAIGPGIGQGHATACSAEALARQPAAKQGSVVFCLFRSPSWKATVYIVSLCEGITSIFPITPCGLG